MTDEERKAIKRLKYKEYCLKMLPYQKKKKSEQSLAYYYRNAEKISIKRKEARKQNESHDRRRKGKVKDIQPRILSEYANVPKGKTKGGG